MFLALYCHLVGIKGTRWAFLTMKIMLVELLRVNEIEKCENTPEKVKLLVASVLHGHQGQAEVSHAMVLDTYDKDNDMLIFKNTYDDPESGQTKQFKVARTGSSAPGELYFVHIEVKDMDNLPGQEERKAIKKAEK